MTVRRGMPGDLLFGEGGGGGLCLLFAALLLGLIVWPLVDHEPYQPIGDDLLVDVEAQYRLGNRSGAESGFGPLFRALGHTDGDQGPWISLSPGDRLRGFIPGPFGEGRVLVFLSIKADGLIRGDLSWNDGRVALVGVDGKGRRLYEESSVVCSAHGDREVIPCHTVLRMSPAADKALLVVGNWGRSGTLQVTKPEAWLVQTTKLADALQFIAIALWLLIALLVTRPIFKAPLGPTLYLVAVVIAVNTMLPLDQFKPLLNDLRVGLVEVAAEWEAGDAQPGPVPTGPVVDQQTANGAQQGDQSDPVSTAPSVAKSGGRVAEPNIHQIQKWGHLFAFGLLAALIFWGWVRQARRSRRDLGVRFGWLVWFAAATEVTQLAIPTRSGALADFLLDLSGMLVGLAVVLPLLALGQLVRGLREKWEKSTISS
jgi:VanZ family protein